MTQSRTMSAVIDIMGRMSGTQIPNTSRFAGIVTTAELLKAGVPAARIRSLVLAGILIPVSRGIFARAEQVRGHQGRDRTMKTAAAVLLQGQAAVASHHDAALLLGIDLLDRPPPVVAVTRPPDAAGSRTGRPGIRIYTAALPTAHITIRKRIPVTTAARTAVDLARTLSFRAGVVSADSALHRGLVTKRELDSVVRECARWPGIGRAKQVVAFSDHRAESPFESIARVEFADGGLPPPELQVWVGGDLEVIGRADFLWRDQHTIAEADGAVKYSDPDRARLQLRRDAELRAAGYEVVHFTWRDLMSAPGQVIASVTEAFARAAALRRGGNSVAGRGQA